MIKKIATLTAVLLIACTHSAFAKTISVSYDGSCESATFEVDKAFDMQGEGNVWSYTGKGTGLCANFFGLGSKVKAKYFGMNGTWLLFSAQSTGSGLSGYQYMIAIQYPVATGGLYIENLVKSDFSTQVVTAGTYTVTSGP
ncbi:MAG TPA: hypothetical protein VFV07_05425 [Rhizomicrobium sp.]|nr:hypothetical protein [Rhizomicrobium sp.]